MKDKVLVSIVLPVYNGERYIAESIESCLNQTYSNIELIIVNDCSTDGSLEIAKSYVEKDSRVRIVNNEVNKKLPASLNIGHRVAKGDYVTWTSDDNKYKLTAIEKFIFELQNNDSDIVCSNFDCIDENGVFKSKRVLPPLEYMIWGNVFGASFMYSRRVFQTLDGYKENLFLVEDYDFWIRSLLMFKSSTIEESLYLYREHDASLTGQITSNSGSNKLWKENLLFTMNSFFSDLELDSEVSQNLSNLIVENYSKKITRVEYIDKYQYFKKLITALEKRINKEFAFKFKETLTEKILDEPIRDVSMSEAIFLIRNFNSIYKITRSFYLLKRGIVNTLKNITKN